MNLVVAEQQITHADTLYTIDTVIVLQLIAVTDTTAENKNAAAREFKRFHNNQAESFYNSNYNNFIRGQTIVGEVENYFVYPLSIAPVTVAWGLPQGLNQCVFAIAIRFKLKENLANYITLHGKNFMNLLIKYEVFAPSHHSK